MKFPKYWTWADTERGSISVRGWSETSMAEAVENAKLRLNRVLEALATDRPSDEYEYVMDGVICEEVIDQLLDGQERVAVISRNRYGALVMNTPNMMFIDIDVPPARRTGCLLGWLRRQPPDEPSPEEHRLQGLRRWQQLNPEFTLRVYRTHSGIRAIVINQFYTSVDAVALRVLDELESDPLYRRLCVAQGCYRARLSPKPWRLGLGDPPARFPYRTPQEEQAFQAWFDEYVHRSKGVCVCQYVETLGDAAEADRLGPLIAQHDALCCSDRDLPLA